MKRATSAGSWIIVDKETGEIIPSFVSIDRKTNEITDIPANKVRIPERIGNTEITRQEQDMLRAGLPVRDKLIERKDGRKFLTTLQVNVEQRGVEFVPGTGRSPRTAQSAGNEGQSHASAVAGYGNHRQHAEGATAQHVDERRRQHPPHQQMERRGLHRAAESRLRWLAKPMKLENVTDKQGFHATMYIRFNPEKGRPYRYDTNPDNAQKVAPSNESRTQVAVNNEGKTNEVDQEPEGAVAEGTDRPEGRNPAAAAGAAPKKKQGHEDIIRCPPLNPK